MANLDTRAKRSSGISVGQPWRVKLPAPDATIAQGDRQAVSFMYSGILAASAAGVTTHIFMGLFGFASTRTTPANDELS